MGPKQLTEHYQKSNVLTAGKVKSQQILLERAIVLSEAILSGDVSKKVPLQNIFSQLQTSLNISRKISRDLHKMYSIWWDVVQLGKKDDIEKVKSGLLHWHETLLMIQEIK
jgi:flagellin-specific chaperone FliS